MVSNLQNTGKCKTVSFKLQWSAQQEREIWLTKLKYKELTDVFKWGNNLNKPESPY